MNKILLILAISFLATTTQAQKFSYVDTDYILNKIPEFNQAQDKLDALSADWQKEIENKYADVDQMYRSYQQEQVLLTDEMKVKREEAIIKKENDAKQLQQKYFGPEGELYIKRQELAPQSGQLNSSAVFYHFFAFIGVLVLGSGVALSINNILSFFTGYNDIALPSSGALKEMSSISITLILVGIAVWAYSWRQVQSNWIAVTQGYYTARRTYIFSMLGIGILTAVVSLAALLFLLLKDLLSAQFTTDTVEAINPSISILITLTPIIAYHTILKKQQESLNEAPSTSKPRNKKRILILVPNDDQNFANALERALGYPVARVNWVDEGAAAQSLENINLDELVSGIEQSVGAGVILIPEPSGIRIYSYN